MALSRSDAKNKIQRGAFHRTVVLEVVTQYGDLLCYAQPKYQIDKEVVLAAVASSSWAVKYVAQELLQDDNFALEMIRANPMALKLLPERCRQDPDLVLAAVKGDGRCLALSPLCRNEDFVREAVLLSPEALEFAPLSLQAEFDLVFCAVSAHGRALRFAAPELQDDRQVALAAVQSCAAAMAYVSGDLQNNRHFVLEVLRLQGSALEYVERFQDEEIVLEAVASNSGALRFSTLRAQRSFVLMAVETAGMSLEHVSAELLDDKEVVLTAVTSNGLALQFASENLKDDEEVVWRAVNQDPCALSFSTFQRNKDFLLRCAKNGLYSALDFADRGLTKDKGFGLSLLSTDVATLPHLSEELREDREILLHAAALSLSNLSQDDQDFRNSALRLRSALAMVRRHPNSRNIVLRAVGSHPLSLWYAAPELQADPDFQEQAAWLIASKDRPGANMVPVA